MPVLHRALGLRILRVRNISPQFHLGPGLVQRLILISLLAVGLLASCFYSGDKATENIFGPIFLLEGTYLFSGKPVGCYFPGSQECTMPGRVTPLSPASCSLVCPPTCSPIWGHLGSPFSAIVTTFLSWLFPSLKLRVLPRAQVAPSGFPTGVSPLGSSWVPSGSALGMTWRAKTPSI